MSKDNPVKDKSYIFALLIIRLAKTIQNDAKEYVLSKQLLRAGTSIGANVEEANAAQTKKDFIAKMSIASKEARESSYWIRLLRDSNYVEENDASRLLKDCEELIRLLTAIVKTSQTTSN